PFHSATAVCTGVPLPDQHLLGTVAPLLYVDSDGSTVLAITDPVAVNPFHIAVARFTPAVLPAAATLPASLEVALRSTDGSVLSSVAGTVALSTLASGTAGFFNSTI